MNFAFFRHVWKFVYRPFRSKKRIFKIVSTGLFIAGVWELSPVFWASLTGPSTEHKRVCTELIPRREASIPPEVPPAKKPRGRRLWRTLVCAPALYYCFFYST